LNRQQSQLITNPHTGTGATHRPKGQFGAHQKDNRDRERERRKERELTDRQQVNKPNVLFINALKTLHLTKNI